MRIYVIARDIQRQDAVGNFCRQIQSFLQARGFDACLVAENCHPNDRSSIEHPSKVIPKIGPDDISFFHFSTEDPAFAAIAALSNSKILYFHNITPERFFEGIDARTARLVRAGLEQRSLATKFDVLMANSRATAQVLYEGMSPAGRSRFDAAEIVMCPPVIDIDRWDLIDEESTDVGPDPKTVLYVGRLEPHKGVRQLIDGFALLAAKESRASLICVGGLPDSAGMHALTPAIEATEPSIRDRIRFVHGISDGALKSIYRKAGVFASMSMHEGFGVPLVDAMVFDKPLVINEEAGMVETAGDAAIIVDGSSPKKVAEALGTALNDGNVREGLALARAERLRTFRRLASGQLILDAIDRARTLHRARIV